MQTLIQSNDFLVHSFELYGLTSVIPFDSAKRTGGFLRIGLGLDERKGLFDAPNSAVAKIRTSYINLNILGHVVADIQGVVRAYTGLGLTLGFATRTEVEPTLLTSSFEFDSKLVFGTNFELGFLLGNSSYIGIQTLINSTGDLKYNGTSLVLGISPQSPDKKRKN